MNTSSERLYIQVTTQYRETWTQK